MIDNERLIGSWRLIKAELLQADGAAIQIFGTAPVSHLFYTKEGFVSLHMMPGGDPPPGDRPLPDPPFSMYSYCGTFRLEADYVFHDLTVAGNPGWVGASLRRAISFQGDNLILIAEESYHEGYDGQIRLIWERVKSDDDIAEE